MHPVEFTPMEIENDEVVRKPNAKFKLEDVVKSPSVILRNEKYEILFCSCGKEVKDFNRLKCDDCIKSEQLSKFKGFLLKQRKNKSLVNYWYTIEKKEMHCFFDKDEIKHKSLHSLKGSFIEEAGKTKINNISYFKFVLFWGMKFKAYLTTDESEFKKWVSMIKNLIGYANIKDFYTLTEDLGNGKFGIVKLGIHNKTGAKVAIKTMQKSLMTPLDVELTYREIEILKLCQHPHIVRLLDVFESKDFMYIVMENLEGGDLFTFLEKRGFKMPESSSSKIIKSLLEALSYLHSYGIVHRDLKPENVLMVDKTEQSEVKIVDFGLSKIVGPNEKSSEPFGTLSYVSPEVLEQKEYGKPIDIWSIGIIAYLMCAGFLPFDHEDDKEVARMTISEPPKFSSSRWSNVSQEAIDFIKKCLCKSAEKRMTLQEALKHKWLELAFEKMND